VDRREPPLIPGEEESSLTPILRQYRELHNEVPNALLFFQVGDFYEAFFEDAVKASEILGITLTTRNRNDPQPVPMAGVPVLNAEIYFKRALRQGATIAICDQVGEEKTDAGPLLRRITRILTPGTALFGEGDDPSGELEPWIWVYLARGEEVGLFRHDFITGTTAYGIFRREDALAYLFNNPCAELIYEEGTDPPEEVRRKGILYRTVAPSPERELLPAGMEIIHRFLRETQRVELKHLSPPEPLLKPDTFALDPRTLKNLEIFQNLWDGGEEGTLFKLLNECQTRMGSRLLREWLRFPLLKPEGILRRQIKVRSFYEHPEFLEAVRRFLEGIPDLFHLVARLSQGSATPETLHQIRKGLRKAHNLLQISDEEFQTIFQEELSAILRTRDTLQDLERTLHPNPPRNLKEGGVIHTGVDPELDGWRSFLSGIEERLKEIELREREKTQIPSLKVGYNRVFGYYIEVPNTQRHRVPSHYYRKQTLAQAERYIIPELKALEVDIEENRERIKRREEEIFLQLLRRTTSAIPLLKGVAQALATLDLVSTLAFVARRYRWEFPKITEDIRLIIREGKHPVLSARESFVPNDTFIDEEKHFVLITGPNMGGKSTYLRQTALIVLLAQIGSAVPARSAEIGIVDRIFTRIGASDALWLGRSTFMVEMEETAQLLRDLTPRSLVILDEIGRGTSTYDGISIARAVSEHLIEQRVRTLFATHFHELISLGKLRGVVLLHPRVHVSDGRVTFLYVMEMGGSPHSYGILVARQAGIPEKIIARAETLLEELERSGRSGVHPRGQLKLFP